MNDWQRRSDLGNPLDVLIRRESVTCKGCRYLVSERCFGNQVEACSLGKKKLRKCSLYGEKG